MEEKEIHTVQDCVETGLSCSIRSKVVVLNCDRKQLYFCLRESETGINSKGSDVFLVSLHNGEFTLKNRSDVIGVLKPELLPDQAKLQLSQIRPVDALDLGSHEPKYSCYSFLPDGRYASGVWLCSEQEALDYVEMQKPYQHRIMICDREDFCVLEMENGRLLYPSQEQLEVFRNRQNGGIQMT